MFRLVYLVIGLVNLTASLYCGWVIVRGPLYGRALPTTTVLLVCILGFLAALVLSLFSFEQAISFGKGNERALSDGDHPGPGPRGN